MDRLDRADGRRKEGRFVTVRIQRGNPVGESRMATKGTRVELRRMAVEEAGCDKQSSTFVLPATVPNGTHRQPPNETNAAFFAHLSLGPQIASKQSVDSTRKTNE